MHSPMQGGRQDIRGDESVNDPDKEHNKAIAMVREGWRGLDKVIRRNQFVRHLSAPC